MQTIRLLTAKDPQLTTKLKHIDIHTHWLRQEVQKGNVVLKYQSTVTLVADGFTKELPQQKHKEFIWQLNMVDLPSYTNGPEALSNWIKTTKILNYWNAAEFDYESDMRWTAKKVYIFYYYKSIGIQEVSQIDYYTYLLITTLNY